MEKQVKTSRLAKIPALVLSLVIFGVSIICAFVFGYVTVPGYSILRIIAMLFLIPSACFVICMIHPKSVWYTPFICNQVALLGTIFHPLAWTTLSEYLLWVFSLGLAVLASIVGAKIGKRRIIQAE